MEYYSFNKKNGILLFETMCTEHNDIWSEINQAQTKYYMFSLVSETRANKLNLNIEYWLLESGGTGEIDEGK